MEPADGDQIDGPAKQIGEVIGELLDVPAQTPTRRKGVKASRGGPSHSTPRRHFPDRQALLDALAEAGFARLDDELCAASAAAGQEFRPRLHAIAAADRGSPPRTPRCWN
ncbi:hypothetical protein FF36_03923 [Frankia torreyi]|uniref:Uncharacterized protein n=1 Tax=Frankia torreyi TaxID=1856 RepID=A0A0D8BCQ5_9ACTN|nr:MULTISPECIES: TetR/AcrR family transcriptional regulator [Frankia]KJE21719.1 hypothetical protein FF36_03923 [Frankia torreyi]KQM03266.1 hypothetical protein FF86_10437 [Frankia sp. CpI1-P]